jgi:hypothetical protein
MIERKRKRNLNNKSDGGMYRIPERTVILDIHLPFKEHGSQSLTVCDSATSMESYNRIRKLQFRESVGQPQLLV